MGPGIWKLRVLAPIVVVALVAVVSSSPVGVSADWRDRFSGGSRWSDRAPANLPPVVDYDPAENTHDDGGVITGNLNATDPEGGALTFTVLRGPAHGTVVLNPDGSFTYRPDTEFARGGGADEFVVDVAEEASAGRWLSRTRANHTTATISLSVEPQDRLAFLISVGTDTANVAVSPVGERAYVTTTDGHVVVIETVSYTVLTTVSVGNNPEGVAVTSDGNFVYVANTTDNTVSVIDSTTDTVVATIAVGAGPRQVAVTPDGTKVYVTNSLANTVSVIDVATNTVLTTIAVGGSPLGMALTPDGARLYVANFGGNSISVIDTETNTVIAMIAVNTPIDLAMSPDGERVYVARDAITMPVIDTTTNTVFDEIPLGASSTLTTRLLVLSPDGSYLYAPYSAFPGGKISVIDTMTKLRTDLLDVGVPRETAVGPDGTLYVTNAFFVLVYVNP